MCTIKIRPIDAPFNILGMPAFIDYYVTHDWEANHMSFVPHSDSNKPSLEAASETLTKQELLLTYSSKNVENGEQKVVLIALAFCIFASCILALYVCLVWDVDGYKEDLW